MAAKKKARRIPWWAYLLMAVLSYYLLKHGIVLLGDAEDGTSPVSGLIAKGAPLAAIAFLLLAANALYDNDPDDDSDAPPGENDQ